MRLRRCLEWQMEKLLENYCAGTKGNRKKEFLPTEGASQPRRCRNTSTRISVWKWKWNCCGIFSRSPKGSESQRQIQHHLPASGKVQHQWNVPDLWRLTQRLLQLCEKNGFTSKRSATGWEDQRVSSRVQTNLRLPQSAHLAREEQNLLQPQNCAQSYE